MHLTDPKIPNPFHTATLRWSPRDRPGEEPSYYIEIVQIGQRIGAPADRAREISTGDPTVEVWVEENEYGVHGYTALFSDRTYLVLIYDGAKGPSESAILDSILSLR